MVVTFRRKARTLLNSCVCRKRRRRLSSSIIFTSRYDCRNTNLGGGGKAAKMRSRSSPLLAEGVVIDGIES